MIPLAAVLRRHWPAYERKYRARLLPSHRRAVAAILSCRTPALGGQLYRCDCGQEHYAYHSCNHRACPQCGHADATEWLQRQRRKLLPVPYYLVTFTVPAQLRQVIRSHQKDLYPLLLRESAGALRDIARDHKDLGAQIGFLAVLQTWTRDLRYHPHVHCVVPGGGLSPDRLRWVSPKREGYFLPQAVLALRFRTRLRQALQQQHPQLYLQIPRAAWALAWVADVQPVGTGEPAFKYLAAYVYRTAFSAERILADDGQTITFTYKDSQEPPPHRAAPGRTLPPPLPPARAAPGLAAGPPLRLPQRRRHRPMATRAGPAGLATAASDPRPTSPVPLCPRCHKPMALIGRLPRAPPA